MSKAAWKRVTFTSGEATLEGLIFEGTAEPTRGVILCHPHPLYGGNMFNPLVAALANECTSLAGATLLRFNFRGTGESTGTHDGEKEWGDVTAAVDFLMKKHPGIGRIDLVGYSFGGWMALVTADNDERVGAVACIAPPVGVFDMSEAGKRILPLLVVHGERDTFAPLPKIEGWLEGLHKEVKRTVIPGADHFFFAREILIGKTVLKFLDSL